MTVVAIDFGTSNTVVSILEADTEQPKTLRFPNLSRLYRINQQTNICVIPSLVYVKDSGEYIFGEQVKKERLGFSKPERLFKNFKRNLTFDSEIEVRCLELQEYSTQLIAEEFIKEIWRNLRKQNIQPSQLILTLPVGAFEKYSDWLRRLVEDLNLGQINLIDESTAAAIGYGVKKPNSLILVVDFGGGTLDLSLIRTVNINNSSLEPEQNISSIEAEVIAKSEAKIGGEDMNQWIVNDIFMPQIGKNKLTEIENQQLLEIAEKLKIKLSSGEQAKESYFDEQSISVYELSINRDQFEYLLDEQDCLEKLRLTLDEVMEIAKTRDINRDDIQEVLLVGGSCLIPAVQDVIKSYFRRYKVKLDKPFEAVSHGALAITQLTKINDYLRHSYTIRTKDRITKEPIYTPLFSRGTRYPKQREEKFQANSSGQSKIELNIFEAGEKWDSEVYYDEEGRMKKTPLKKRKIYQFLGKCEIILDPPGEIGMDRILVKFEVSSLRVLEVTVIDLLTDNILLDKKVVAELI